ncbi:MAG: leucyl/phenylalanyl-tRNA--protein transferase [Pseudomonadota bacterium]|nr:leucyl/phenylalanyl-tRNA--protein transferase [Pseudomonadota bacterium]
MSSLHYLADDHAEFPPVGCALEEPNGLLAVGGDLSVPRLLEAYRRGVFPWYEADQPILWWSPDPRAIVDLEHWAPNRTLRKLLRRSGATVRFDHDFAGVVEACAGPRQGEAGTWITPEMRAAYQCLHEAGHAHAVTVWYEGELAGGLYGVALDRCFFGESMFSRRSGGSKLAFTALAKTLRDAGGTVIDCQMSNPHVTHLGAREIPRTEFCRMLEVMCRRDRSVVDWAALRHQQPLPLTDWDAK